MIVSFNKKLTKKFWETGKSKLISPGIQRLALRKLVILNDAEEYQDLMSPPGNRLEELKGNRKGQLSIRINDQWRICFKWKNNDAHDVEIVDYH